MRNCSNIGRRLRNYIRTKPKYIYLSDRKNTVGNLRPGPAVITLAVRTMNKLIVTLPYMGVPHQYYLEVDDDHVRFYFHPTFAHRDAPSFGMARISGTLTWEGPADPVLEEAATAEVTEFLRSWKR